MGLALINHDWLPGALVDDTSCVTDLFEQVPDPHHAADEQTHQVLGVKLIVDDFCGEMKSRGHACVDGS